MKKVLAIILLSVVYPLMSQGIKLEDFKLSSYTLKSYYSDGKVKNEATYGSDHAFIGVYTYEYREDGLLDRIEYYSATAVKPTVKKYTYEETILTMVESYSSKNKVISTVKYYYQGDNEVKREYFDKYNKLKTIQHNLFSEGGLKVKAEYYSKNKKHLQDYKYYYNKDGKQVKTEIVKNEKLSKSIYTKYNDHGNTDYIYYQNSDGRISQLYIHTYDENNRLVEYKKYILK